jgi:hypothetical protein
LESSLSGSHEATYDSVQTHIRLLQAQFLTERFSLISDLVDGCFSSAQLVVQVFFDSVLGEIWRLICIYIAGKTFQQKPWLRTDPQISEKWPVGFKRPMSLNLPNLVARNIDGVITVSGDKY